MTQIRQSGEDRVLSLHCWTTGNDGVSVAGVLWLSVIVSGLRLKQRWVTQAPNANHHGKLGWLNRPGRRDQTVCPLARAGQRTCSPRPHRQTHFHSDHLDGVTLPFGISHWSCTLSPNLYKVFRQKPAEKSICLCRHGHRHKGSDKSKSKMTALCCTWWFPAAFPKIGRIDYLTLREWVR